MLVTIEWTPIPLGDRRLDWNRCLYAYAHPDSLRFVYVGKAYANTIAERLRGPHKEELLARLRQRFGTAEDWIPDIIHGRVTTERGRRVTKPVLRDVESLLIKRLRPCENTNCKGRRIERPGMIVECNGIWPYARRRFFDAREVKELTFPTTAIDFYEVR